MNIVSAIKSLCRQRWLVLVFFWAVSLDPASAQSLFSSHTWQTDDGLPHNTVLALAQTPDGYLWIGTREGLARFDGVRFTVFNSRNTPELKGRVISALCATHDGNLWIGMEDGGLARLSEGRFSYYDQSNGLPGTRVKTLMEDEAHVLWVGTMEGLARFKDEKFSLVPGNDEFPFHSVLQMGRVRDNGEYQFWLVTDVGLYARAKDQFTAIGPGFSRTDKLARSVCSDTQGNLWIGGMLGLIRTKGSEFTYFTKTNGLPDSTVLIVKEDTARNLWVGTSVGLFRFANNEFIPEVTSEGEAYGFINALLEDREGNLWIGSKEGLTRLHRKQFFTYTLQHGLANNNVMSVREDKAGTIWIGTWGGGPNQLIDGKVQPFACPDLVHQPSDFVLALLEGADGSLWFGADFDGGMCQFKDNKITRYWRHQYELGDPAVKVLYEDRNGNLWIGARTALLKLIKGQMSRFTTTNGLAGNMIQAICETRDGTLQFATSEGLSSYRDGKFLNSKTSEGLSDNNITALYEDAAGALWLGTRSVGLNRFANGKFKSCSTKDGLFDDGVLEMVEDDFGWMWMASLKGIFKTRKSELDEFMEGKAARVTCVSYGRSDGLGSTQCNGVAKPSIWKSKDGRLWFATTKGVAVTDPGSGAKDKEVQPIAVIENVLVDTRPLLIGGGEKEQRRKREDGNSLLTIAPGRGELEFRFTAPIPGAPEKALFKYKLEGVDADWVDARSARSAHYNNIAPGAYRFEVTAWNSDGAKESNAALSFVLLPHFWQTQWFLALAGILFVSALAGTVRYLTWRKAQAQMRWLEQQHALERERGRIAKDMHDDLGANLTQITLLSELAKRDLASPDKVVQHVDRISGTARDLVIAMNEIVWAVNPQNDNLRKLAGYIFQYSEKFLTLAQIRCRMDRPFALPDESFTSEVRHNLFLVVKEALNNIVKHSGATEVWLRLQVVDANLRIVIEDNGRGFGVGGQASLGNGLQNMKQRMEEMGGAFAIKSSEGKGTKVELTLPMKSARR